MSLQNVSIVLSPTMQISHRVLNVLFTYSKILFRDIIINKLVFKAILYCTYNNFYFSLYSCNIYIQIVKSQSKHWVGISHLPAILFQDHQIEIYKIFFGMLNSENCKIINIILFKKFNFILSSFFLCSRISFIFLHSL